MKQAQDRDKIDLQISPGAVMIPDTKGGLMECKIIAPFEPVDEKSIHVVTNRGIFLVSINYCTIDGKEMMDVEELKLKIPEKKQINPS